MKNSAKGVTRKTEIHPMTEIRRKTHSFCWNTCNIIWCLCFLCYASPPSSLCSLIQSEISEYQAALPFRSDLQSGPGCSKLTTSLVNVSLKFQMLISQICQYFLLRKCEKRAKASLIFSTKNISVFGYKVLKHLTS